MLIPVLLSILRILMTGDYPIYCVNGRRDLELMVDHDEDEASVHRIS